MIRQRICSNPQEMEELHQKHSWIPGGESIRPSPEMKEKKRNYMENILTRYESLQDLVLHRFFNLSVESQGNWSESKFHVRSAVIESALANSNGYIYRIVPNTFAYQVPSGTNHYVLWFLYNDKFRNCEDFAAAITDEEINRCIEDSLKQRVEADKANFSFVWYPNPKSTVHCERLYHVQVFWKV